MGIQGLLPFLKKIHQPVNVSQFAGCTVAIDAYCWLHKGAFSCAEKLALGEKTDQYVYYCMKYINYLLSKNIKPVLVFDGCHLPSKKNVEKSRREKRELNRKKAAQFLREGKRAEARECLQRCIDISPEMALELMNACRDRGVDCIVAPYEADAQLAYLSKIGIAQLIITEDSDLLLFGCEKVLFKMDHAGNGILIEQKRLNEVTDIQSGQYSFDRFRYLCILSGCDYLPSLSGIGLARANKVFKIARQADVEQLLKKLPTYLKSNISVPQEYIDGFIAANNTFLYQFVFDPLQRRLVPLNPYPPDVNPDELSYAGAPIPAKKALQIALGNVNIYTGEIFASYNPDTYVPKYQKKKPDMLHMLSIWDKNYRVKPKAVLHETQLPDRPSLQGKEIHVKAKFKKRSPQKRVREDEDDIEMKSNTELCDLYSSPVKKRKKAEDIDDDLQRFMYASKEDAAEEDETVETEEKGKPGLGKSPQFFNSLSEAHPAVKVETDLEMENDLEKENHLTSPRRNIFASKSPLKKPRFDLNAPKQKALKSRFFSSATRVQASKPSPTEGQKSPESRNSEENLLSSYQPVHSNTANVYVSTSNSPSKYTTLPSNSPSKCATVPSNSPSKDMATNIINITTPSVDIEEDDKESVVIREIPVKQHFQFSKEAVNESPKPLPCGRSAFNWSKFKFNRVNSCDSIQASQKSSKQVKKPFKKVVSESTLQTFLRKTDNSGENESENDVVASPYADKIEPQDESDAVSIDSYPYSIDSDCLRDVTDTLSGSQMSFSQQSDCSSVTDTSQGDNKKKSTLSIYFKPYNNSQTEISTNTKESKTIECDKEEKAIECGLSLEKTYKNNEEENTVYLIQSDEDTEADPQLPSLVPKITSNKVTSAQNKGKSRPGCKVSGLSKRSKKLPHGQDTAGKQQNLKDMFAKFAHNKCDKPKLSHDVIDCDIDDARTPEGSSSLLKSKTGLQKRLLK